MAGRTNNRACWTLRAGLASAAVAGLMLAGLPAYAQAPPGASLPKQAAPQQTTQPNRRTQRSTVPAQRSSRRRAVPAAQRRDPFVSLRQQRDKDPGTALPPGIRGLVISRLTVGGIIVGARGRIAVVTMTGRDRAFFLRVRDRLYDGFVKRIQGDRVIFREKTTDVFGRPVERDVAKELVVVSQP